ncbi:unnamed protein product [Effrenium voratum]|uniref:Uncharacterized protein n=1 Tax=Effrenium voratum TaxID=2562239 RepID=A0AA36HX88_9DINO|nr:unnamed protein product [Effrenium voratum]CAJ1416487.1 unnamed protein product [Effrenium voratum]
MASTCVTALDGAPADLDGTHALRGLLYQERPARENARVHWDEQCIAEHDKERGTRQKIDEPDTPFVRSPQTSDSEDEDHARPKQPAVVLATEATESTARPFCAKTASMVTSRLNEWVQDGGRRDSKGSTGSTEEAKAIHRANPRVTLPEEERPSSSSFKVDTRVDGDHPGDDPSKDEKWRSKRTAHYRDMAAAFRSAPPDSDSESDGSETN